jgi:hypothetical protein
MGPWQPHNIWYGTLFVPLIINIMVITKALSPLSKAFQQTLAKLFVPLIINRMIITKAFM